jgi:hypothetical protein
MLCVVSKRTSRRIRLCQTCACIHVAVLMRSLLGEHKALELGKSSFNECLLLLLVQVCVTHGW